MFNPEIFAVNFARTVALLREPRPDKEQQKASLRAVFALTSLAAATVRLYDGVLSVDETVVRDDLPFTATLRDQLTGHEVAEVVVTRGASATELLALLKAIAADVGSYAPGDGVAKRLADAGATGVAVLAARKEAPEPGRRAPSITQAFDLAAIEEAEARAALEERALQEPAFEEPAAVEGPPPEPAVAEPVPEEPPPAPVWPAPVEWEEEPAALEPLAFPAPPTFAPTPAREAPPGPRLAPAARDAAAEMRAKASEHHLPETLAAPHGVPETSPTGLALSAVANDPYGQGILDRLSDLAGEVGADLRDGRLESGVQAIAAIIGLEPGAPEGSPRASYGIVLRRMLTHDALRHIAMVLPDPRFAPIATAVMRRGGADGADVLVELLTTSDVPRDRKAFLAALRVIPQGTAHVISMLGHSQWVIVKNVADLLGDLRVEEAVPALGKLLVHYEPRVRRAAAVSLAKIGTVSTVEPLRRALKDGTPELRQLVAGSIGGQHSRALAMPLVALAETETTEPVVCEYYRALGRIGSNEAVEALVKAAAPGGRIFGRRASAPRMAAVEGLRVAANAASRRALEALKEDADKGVRDAVHRALSGEGASSAPG